MIFFKFVMSKHLKLKEILIIFISISFLSKIISYECGFNPPNKSSDCFSFNETNSSSLKCCYLYNKSVNETFCKLLSDEYLDSRKTFNLNEIEFNVECHIPQAEELGTPCGTENPQVPNDCIKFSTVNNRCCFHNRTNPSFCYWLGMNLSKNDITLNSTVYCNDSYINAFYIFNLILILTLI